jgi:hypothetical protein
MKFLPILLILIVSCTTMQPKSIHRPQEPLKIISIQKQGETFIVTLKGGKRTYTTYCDCPSLPDSVKVGAIINL